MFCLLSIAVGLFLQTHSANEHLKGGLVALKEGELSKAQRELEAAEQQEPTNAYIWVSLAQTYLRLGQLEKAESAATKGQELAGQDTVIAHALGIFYFEYAQVLLRKEDFGQAAAVVSKALETDPTNVQLTLALGVARYGQRRFDESVTCFLHAIQLDPTVEKSYVFLGKMLDQAGAHLTEITRDDEEWLRQSPQNAKAALMLAKALLTGDSRSERAVTLLGRSIELDPNDWESHYELGVLLANRHEYEKAAAELNRSIELNAAAAMPHYHLARVYDRLGQGERAQSERAIHARLSGTTAQ